MFAKGQMANLMSQAQKMNQKMTEMQEQLGSLEAQGEAAAGMVKVSVNGHKELTNIHIANEAMDDKEMLEDLIVAAYNSALTEINEKIQQKTAEVTTGMGLPPNIKLPF